MAKVTIYDIAEKLHVSPASVTRALNGMPKVGEEKRKLIIETAERMGYSTNRLAASLARKPVRIAVLLYASIHDFYNKIYLGIEDAYKSLEDFNIRKDLYILNTQKRSDADVVQVIEEIGKQEYSGLLIHSIHDNPVITAAVQKLMNKKITVYTINTDISIDKKHYCVTNNAAVAGRMAAELLDWSVANRKICFFMGGREAKVLGTINDAFMEEAAQRNLQIIDSFYDDDSREKAYENVDTMLENDPDVGGVYINSAISFAVCNRLLELEKAHTMRIVTSDLLPDIITHLKSGIIQATIYQDPFLQGRLGFLNLYKIIAEGASIDNQIYVTPLILTKSNIDLYL